MSGIKDVYVTMTSSQRDSLIRNARVAQETAVQAQYRQRQAENALYNAQAKLDKLNQTLNKEISGLNEEISQMAKAQNERLARQARDVNKTVDELKLQMEQNKRELEGQIGDINARLDKKEQTHKQIAEFWIGQTEAYFADIAEYRHELFTPNELAMLKMQLSQVESDMRAEAFEAAISTSRSVFNKAALLKESVVSAEIEWNGHFSKLQKQLAKVKSDINYSKEMQFVIPTEEGDVTIDANIDYWTENALSVIESQVQALETKLENAENMRSDEIVAFINELRIYEEQIINAQNRAKDAIISSQMRADMAQNMANALENAGWSLCGCTYEEGEENKPLHIKFSNGYGDEIVAVISPDCITENFANNLAINFFDPYNNDESMRGIWIDNIRNTLSEAGLNVGEAKCREGYEVKQSDNERIRDIERTARKGVV